MLLFSALLAQLNNPVSTASVNTTSNSQSLVLFEFPSLNLTDSTLYNTFRIKLASQPDISIDIFLGSDHNSLIFSDCHKTFNSDNWNIWQNVTVTGVPVFNSNSTSFMNIIARGFHKTLIHDSFLPVTRYLAPAQTCSSIGDPHYTLFDGFAMTQMGSGSFYLFDSPQLTIQTYQDIYSGSATVNKAVAVRYGKSIVVLDVTNDYLSPFKTVRDDSNMTGMVFTLASAASHNQVITLPDGSSITLSPNKDAIASYINVDLALSAGYPFNTGGMCNRKASNNRLWMRNGTAVGRDRINEFANSWIVPDNENLFEGKLPLSIDPPKLNRAGSICKIPVTYTRPVPLPPPSSLPLYAPSLKLATKSSSTLIPPPPQAFIDESIKLCNKIFRGISCDTVVDHKPYVAICIADSKTTGSYHMAEIVKQSYLSKCNSMTNYMLYDPVPSVAQKATQVQAQLGLGNNSCTKICLHNGQCTHSGCVCQSGYTGADCSISTAPLISYNPATQNFSLNNPTVGVPLPSYPESAPLSQPATSQAVPCTPGSSPPPVIQNPSSVNQAAPTAQSVSLPSLTETPASDQSSSSVSNAETQPSYSHLPSRGGLNNYDPSISSANTLSFFSLIGFFVLFHFF